MVTVYTGGTFDLLHAGHIDLLKACKKIAGVTGKVVVSLNTDAFIKEFKTKGPVCTFEERKIALEACRYVDRVVENIGNEDSTIAITQISPDFVVIGDDWARKDYYKQMGFTSEWLIEHNITLIYVARQRILSSTLVKTRVIREEY